MTLDRRLYAYKDDVADAKLRGKVQALRYVTPEPRQVTVSIAPVLREPRYDAPTDTQALLGEPVHVFQIKDGWAFVQLVIDHYVGFIPARCLSSQVIDPTHRIAVPQTLLYTRPDIKSNPVQPAYMNSLVSVVSVDGELAKLRDHRYVWARHLRPIEEHWDDPATVAEAFVNTPYLWGGKSWAGIDCSGLVQVAFQACGFDCPRDSDMLHAGFGRPLKQDRSLRLQRNDLVFWKGHIGIMLDNATLLHANGYHMQTVVEPLSVAIKRIADLYGTVTGVSRLKEFSTPSGQQAGEAAQ